MDTMTCDADCTRAGWIEYYAATDDNELHVSVHPDGDLDGWIRVFDHDYQEMITLEGWQVGWELI